MNDAPHAARLALLGIPVAFEADDAGLLGAALAGYSAWPGVPAEAGEPLGRLRLRFASGPVIEGAMRVVVDEPRLTLTGRGVAGWADAQRREAEVAVAPEWASDAQRLAAEVLDTLLLFVLTRAGRVPVHGSGVVISGTAVVLAGASGAGKSTLSLAAQRAGHAVLSDDTVYVQLRPRSRVWGFPRPIHVYPADAEAAGEPATASRLRSGKWKAAVPVPSSGAGPVADRAVVCLLERGDAVSLSPISPDEAVRRMDALLEPGFRDFRAALPEAVRALAAGGAWRLTLSGDPSEAIAAVARVVEDLAATARKDDRRGRVAIRDRLS